MDGPKVGSIWRHKNRGTHYRIITTRASLQCAAAPEFEEMFEDDHFVVYKSEAIIGDGGYWVRPLPEFMDGRFVLVKDAE